MIKERRDNDEEGGGAEMRIKNKSVRVSIDKM